MIFTRALNLGLSFANLGFKYFSKIQLNLKNQLFLYNFSSFLLRYILWCLIKSFINNNSAFFRLNFQFSVQTSRQTIIPDHQFSPRSEHQIKIQHHTIVRPTTKSDHQSRPPPPPVQTTRSDHPTRPQTTILQTEQHTQPLEMVQVRCILYGLGQGGYIELWMNLAKHTFHTPAA